MDISSWGPSTLRSAEWLAQHPHLLDAGLARVLAHGAVALPLGAQLWRDLEGRSRPRPGWWPAAVFLCGMAGAWLAVRTSALGVGEEGIGLASVERSPPWRTYAALLLDTRYGTAWLAYAGCLALAVLPQAGLARIGILGSLLALAASTHAAGSGLGSPRYWLHVLHLAAALTWLGGLAVLCTARFGRARAAGPPQLQAFSRAALPLFLIAVATGIASVAAQLDDGLSAVYLAVLGLKLAAVVGAAAAARRLRLLLRQPAADFDVRYDGTLGTEVFFAALLLLAAALLTQVSPS